MDLKYIGHSAFELKLKDNSVLVDPYVSINPKYDWHKANITDIFLICQLLYFKISQLYTNLPVLSHSSYFC